MDNQCQIKPIESNAESKLLQKERKTKSKTTSDDVRALPYKLKLVDLKNIQLKNYEKNVSSDAIDTTSPYVEIVCDDGKRIVVRKTSLCWLLGSDCRKMSCDRLLRVRYSLSEPMSKTKLKSKQKINKHFASSILKSCNPT